MSCADIQNVDISVCLVQTYTINIHSITNFHIIFFTNFKFLYNFDNLQLFHTVAVFTTTTSKKKVEKNI